MIGPYRGREAVQISENATKSPDFRGFTKKRKVRFHVDGLWLARAPQVFALTRRGNGFTTGAAVGQR